MRACWMRVSPCSPCSMLGWRNRIQCRRWLPTKSLWFWVAISLPGTLLMLGLTFARFWGPCTRGRSCRVLHYCCCWSKPVEARSAWPRVRSPLPMRGHWRSYHDSGFLESSPRCFNCFMWLRLPTFITAWWLQGSIWFEGLLPHPVFECCALPDCRVCHFGMRCPRRTWQFVLADLDRFCKVTGFHLTQTELIYDHVWSCRRYCSWWVRSLPDGGLLHLRPRPTLSNICAVQQFLVADLLACAPCAYGCAMLQDLHRSTTLVGHERRGISVQKWELTLQALSLVTRVAWLFRGLAVCRLASYRCFLCVSQLGFCNFWEVTITPRCCFPGVSWPRCRLHCIVRRFSTVGGDSHFRCSPLVVGRFLAVPLVASATPGLWCTQDGSRPLNVARAANWDKLVVWNMFYFSISILGIIPQLTIFQRVETTNHKSMYSNKTNWTLHIANH